MPVSGCDGGGDVGPRLDAADKVRGVTRYTADVSLAGMCHVALVRSPLPHAEIAGIDTGQAGAAPGVVGVFTAEDVPAATFGRRVRDIPILARGTVRFIGERVAAVVAATREQAERAAQLVDVHYRDLPAVLDAGQAVRPGAPLVHQDPGGYPGAAVTRSDQPNLQSYRRHGDRRQAERLLAQAAYAIDRVYTTPTGHHGYLEPQACVADARVDGSLHIWATDKSPYRLREELAACLAIDATTVVVHPVAIGGDFGGKGLIGDAPLCAALSRLTRRPVRLALRYSEDLTATSPRHPTRIRVRVGGDRDGHLLALHVDVLADGGAYAGFKPRQHVDLHGLVDAGSPYRIPAVYIESRIAYTNSVPRGHMRAPGGPQVTFAVESALDELATAAGVSPVDLRRHNLLRTGEPNPRGVTWAEVRGGQTLEAALAAVAHRPAAPAGWLTGTGVAVYDRGTTRRVRTSLRLVQQGRLLRAEVPVPETGTGSHTALQRMLASGLGIAADRIRVVHVPTAQLPYDRGAGGSRVTVGLGRAAAAAVEAWQQRGSAQSVTVDVDDDLGVDVTSYCVQVATVAVDPQTGVVRVLDLLTALDVAEIVNPVAHQMQVDGGTAMGYGFACLEDLQVEAGQVWSGHLGEFKIPSIRDLPPLRTVLVAGGRGVGALNLKAVGELTIAPTAAAIANAVAAACGVRIRSLPIRAETVWALLNGVTGRDVRGGIEEGGADESGVPAER
jgi:CO/xanthine dehydrogenase Mo-binding subunit